MRIYWLIAFALGLLVLLKWQFPDAAVSADDKMRIGYMLAFILIIAGGGAMARITKSEIMRYAGIWAAILAALMLAYYGLLALSS